MSRRIIFAGDFNADPDVPSNPGAATLAALRAMDMPKTLRQSGLKATLPRLKILQVFHHSNEKHVSAEDIYRLLLEENIDVGLATVYRVLMQFTAAGILIRRHFESGHAVFELNEGQHHDHLICVSCGKVEEFVDPEIERHQEQIARRHGFELQDHSLSLYGLCADCAQKERRASKV